MSGSERETDGLSDRRGLTAFALLVALLALLQCWNYSASYPGEDFYLAWSPGRFLADTPDVYSTEGRQDIARAMAEHSARPEALAGLREVARRHTLPILTHSPFLLAIFHVATSDDYVHDYFWYRLLQLIATALGVYAWARIFGHGRAVALLALAVFTLAFEPTLSALRTSNVSQFQLALLALCVLLPGRSGGGRREVARGVLLGLAVLFKPNLAVCVAMLLTVRAVERRGSDLVRLGAGLAAGCVAAALFAHAAVGSHAEWGSWFALLRSVLDAPPGVDEGNYALGDLLGRATGLPVSNVLLVSGFAACAWLLGWRARVAPGADARRSDGLALALGAAVTLLASPLVWLHYYNLAVPLALFCLRPKALRRGGTEGTLWLTLVSVAVLTMALRPLLQVADPGDADVYAWHTVLGTLALTALAVVSVRRAPGLGAPAASAPDAPTPDAPVADAPVPDRPSVARATSRRAPWVLLAVGLLVYANSLQGEFHLDDLHRVVKNPAIREVSLMRDLTDPGTFSVTPRIVQFRPLAAWSFSLNHAVHGLSPSGYHLVNLAFLLVASWLVFALVRELLVHWGRPRAAWERAGPASSPLDAARASRLALVAALLFCVHPVSALVVNYVSARDLVMMQAFLLAALLVYVRMRRLGDSKARWAVILACFSAALLCKTNAAVFPVLVLVFGLVVEGRRPRDAGLWLHTAVLLVPVALFVGYCAYVLGFSDVSTAQGPMSPLAYGMVQLEVHVTHYLSQLAWPWPIRLAPAVEATGSLSRAGTWVGLAWLVGSLGAAIAWRRRRPLVAFSILAWWILLAPTSSVFPLHHLAAHYRPFPASPFLWLALVPALAAITPRRLAMPAALVALAWFSAATLAQNDRSRTEASLWAHSVAHGGDHVAHFSYAKSRPDQSAPEVREHLERSLEISPEYVFARLRLGELEVQHGDVEIGLAMIEETARRYPEWAEAAYSLGRMLVGQGRHAEAADAHARAAAIEPQTLRYHYAAARNHQLAGDVEASLPYLESCERIQSGYEDVAFLLGYALQTTGRRDEAVECYRRHLAVDPDHLQTNYNLGYALMQAERPADAIPFFRRTLEVQEGYLSAERYLAECERGAGVETPRD